MQVMRRLVGRLLPFLVVTLLAQTPPADEHTIRISVNLVEVDAVVTDLQGHPVKDLTKDDFELLQDKKPQPIRSVQWIPWGSETGPVALVPAGGPGLPVPVVAGKAIGSARAHCQDRWPGGSGARGRSHTGYRPRLPHCHSGSNPAALTIGR